MRARVRGIQATYDAVKFLVFLLANDLTDVPVEAV